MRGVSFNLPTLKRRRCDVRYIALLPRVKSICFARTSRNELASLRYPSAFQASRRGIEHRRNLRASPTVHAFAFHQGGCMFFRNLSSTLFHWANLLFATALISPMSALAQGAGSWHTNGNQILDSNNEQVRIAGINWYGFETTDEVVHGLWAQDYHAILNAIKSNGYNTIRLPYSNQMVESPIVPSNISYFNGSGPINADLKGLNSLQIMDKVIGAAGSDGLRVILVNHRSEAGNSAEANGLWYTSAYPESAWI